MTLNLVQPALERFLDYSTVRSHLSVIDTVS